MIKYVVLMASTLSVAVSLFAQNPEGREEAVEEYGSLLWEINRADLDQPSYLYGTIHLIPADSFFLLPSVEEKLASSQQLVLEIPLDLNFGSIFSSMMWMMIPGGKSLKDYMEEEEYAFLKSFMQDSISTPIPMYHKIKPLITAQQISTAYCGEEKMESYEMIFSQKFKEMERPISGLETMKDQMKALDAISIEEQAESLLETLHAPQDACDQLSEMVSIYRQQDLNALMAMTEASEDLDGHLEGLLDKRNAKWIPKIEELVAKEQVFIAVGAGHLAGSKGVIHLLREAGYTVEPIVESLNMEE